MTRQIRLRDRGLVSQRAVTTEKGVEPTQMYGESVRGVDPLSQGPRQSAEATKTIDEGKRQRLTKRKSARCIRTWTRTSRLDTVKKSNELIPLRPLRSLTVREHFHSSLYTFLIVPSDTADTSAVPSHFSEENTDPNAAADEDKSDWKSTAFATAKLLLYGVRDSADAFGPLKAVAGGLCFILENCEVQFSPAYAVAALTCIPANKGE